MGKAMRLTVDVAFTEVDVTSTDFIVALTLVNREAKPLNVASFVYVAALSPLLPAVKEENGAFNRLKHDSNLFTRLLRSVDVARRMVNATITSCRAPKQPVGAARDRVEPDWNEVDVTSTMVVATKDEPLSLGG